MTRLSVPDEAVKFIAFQRTEALRFTNTLVYSALKRIVPFSLYNLAVAFEARLSGERIKRFYVSEIEREFAVICDHLPQRCTSILDIGCGIAGIDALLYGNFREQQPDVYLLDRTQTEGAVFYGFRQRGAFYNSLGTARAMLARNGVPTAKIHLLEATPENEIDISRGVDLVVSLISWGFHYPVETYLERVGKLMNDEARLIIDVRKDTGGTDALKRAFRHTEVISDQPKFERMLARK